MKAIIRITGQINGNNKLVNNLGGSVFKRNGMFYSYILYYDTISEAKKAIQYAHKQLKEDGSEKYKDNSGLSYDASKAVIETISAEQFQFIIETIKY